jgi:hypothetical protein
MIAAAVILCDGQLHGVLTQLTLFFSLSERDVISVKRLGEDNESESQKVKIHTRGD